MSRALASGLGDESVQVRYGTGHCVCPTCSTSDTCALLLPIRYSASTQRPHWPLASSSAEQRKKTTTQFSCRLCTSAVFLSLFLFLEIELDRCLNRYYPAEGLRQYTLETWQNTVGMHGKDLICTYISGMDAHTMKATGAIDADYLQKRSLTTFLRQPHLCQTAEKPPASASWSSCGRLNPKYLLSTPVTKLSIH